MRMRFWARSSSARAASASMLPSGTSNSLRARSAVALARSTSISSESSAESARMMTFSRVTCRKPPLVAINASKPLMRVTLMRPVVNSASMGACFARTPNEPSTPGARIACTSSENITFSGVTNSRGNVAIKRSSLRLGAQRFRLLDSLIDDTDIVERLLRQVVMDAPDKLFEGADGLLERHVFAGQAGELFRDTERLRHELLHAAGAGDDQFVVVGEFVNAEDGDNVLKLFVALQDLLHAARHLIVLLPDDVGLQDAGGGGQRVDSGIDALLGDTPLQIDVSVQVGEGGRRGRVGRVVGGHVDGLDGSDGPLLGGGDALLELAHLGSQRGLVADRAGDAAQQGGHFGACLHKPEDVVHEEEHVLLLHIAEVFGDGEGGEGDAQARPRRLVHLPEDHGGLGDNARLGHFQPEVIALAGALAHARKDGEASVLRGDVGDQFLNENGLAQSGAAEQADLTALEERGEQIHDLEAGFENFLGAVLFGEGGGGAMDGPVLLGVHRPALVYGLAQQIEDAPQSLAPDRDGDGR